LKEFDYRLELDLAGTLSSTTGLRAQMTDGYVTWKRFPAVMLRAGQFKTPYGFEQLYTDSRLLTIERTLSSDRLTQSRRSGAMILGGLPGERLTWSIGAFNGTGQNDNFNDDDAFLWVGRAAGVPWRGRLADRDASWSVGVDGFLSHDTSVAVPPESGLGAPFAGRRRAWGADTQFRVGPVDLWAEYLRTVFRPKSGSPAERVEASGWYVLAGVYILPRAQAVVRYDRFDPEDIGAKNTRRTWTVGGNYLLKSFLKFQLDYMRVMLPGQPGQHKLLARVQAQI
jgi:phosphate-selective porin